MINDTKIDDLDVGIFFVDLLFPDIVYLKIDEVHGYHDELVCAVIVKSRDSNVGSVMCTDDWPVDHLIHPLEGYPND